ncbi:NUDIX domain-containing protein [Fictibacillus sp. UD]|uniref:NUDIX domain-containing protein n=1 Tax=Fictibacillus sp. UD TaxID=3038777 RepID=UPI003744D9A9
MYKIRSSVKALIIKDNHVLTIEKGIKGSSKYVIPGGGQNFNETLANAVVRECFEEIGVEVQVGKLVWVREFISKNHIIEQQENNQAHIVEHIFDVKIDEGILDEFSPNEPDSTQLGVVWLPISKLSEFNFFPKELIPMIQQINDSKYIGQTYVGDIN